MASRENAEVFISYARKDGSEAALSLKNDLEASGLAVWLDTDRIEGGARWTREIEEAIDRCEVLLGLMTMGSFESDICRAEQMRALRVGKCVIPVRLRPATDVPLYFETKNWREYPKQFTDLLADIRSRRGGGLKENYRATRVEYVTLPPTVPHYVDRPEAIRGLRQTVLSDDRPRPVAVTALEGMGGIGKTVLAQALCRDDVVQAAFPDGIVWLTVGRERKYPVVTQLREVAKALGEDVGRYENDLAAENQYRTTLRNKAALIILDDIWSAADLQPFLTESTRSRFLFTTRDAAIARLQDAREHRAGLLDDAQARELLAQWTRRDSRELPAAAAEIIHECGRLPLALATMGALLQDAPPEAWQEWLDRLRRADLTGLEAVLPEKQASFFRAVDVSVRALTPEMQARYHALAVLLEDMSVALPVLCCLWNVDIATARPVAKYLGDRSLAEWDPAVQRLRLHDLQLDYVRAQHADREALDVMLSAVRLSADVIEEDPSQFAPQIVGRLLPYGDVPAVALFVEAIDNASPGPWLKPLQPALHPPGTHLLRTLRNPSSSDLHAVSVMRDGRRAISGDGGGTLRVWDLESGRIVSTLQGHSSAVNAVTVTPDGKRAVSGSSDKTLRVWDLETSRALYTLEGHSGTVRDVAVMPDGRRAISASDDGTLKVWDLDTGHAVGTLDDHSAVSGVAAISDGQVVSASLDKTLKVWDVEDRRVVRTLEGHASAVTGVAVTADARRAISASHDRTLKVWDLETGGAQWSLEGHSFVVYGVAVTGDGLRAISASGDKTLKVWHLETGRLLRTFEGHARNVVGVAVTPDSRRAVSASWDGTLKVWDLERGRARSMPEGHSDSVKSVAVTRDGRRAVSASNDYTLKIWDVASGRILRTLEGHSADVRGVAVTPDGRCVVSGSDDDTLKVWDLQHGDLLRTMEGHSGPVASVAITPDGRYAVSASWDMTLKVWELETGRALRTLEGHSAFVVGVTVTPDGNCAVSAAEDDTLTVWDLQSGRPLRTLEGHSDFVSGVTVMPDGRRAVSASWDRTLRVWDLQTGRTLRTLEGHTDHVRAVAVTPSGRRAVSASHDHTLKIWNLESGKPLAAFRCDAATHCCACVDEDTFVAGDQGGRVYFLRLKHGNASGTRLSLE